EMPREGLPRVVRPRASNWTFGQLTPRKLSSRICGIILGSRHPRVGLDIRAPNRQPAVRLAADGDSCDGRHFLGPDALVGGRISIPKRERPHLGLVGILLEEA